MNPPEPALNPPEPASDLDERATVIFSDLSDDEFPSYEEPKEGGEDRRPFPWITSQRSLYLISICQIPWHDAIRKTESDKHSKAKRLRNTSCETSLDPVETKSQASGVKSKRCGSSPLLAATGSTQVAVEMKSQASGVKSKRCGSGPLLAATGSLSDSRNATKGRYGIPRRSTFGIQLDSKNNNEWIPSKRKRATCESTSESENVAESQASGVKSKRCGSGPLLAATDSVPVESIFKHLDLYECTPDMIQLGRSEYWKDKFLEWRYYRGKFRTTKSSNRVLRDEWQSWCMDPISKEQSLDELRENFYKSNEGICIQIHDLSLSQRIHCAVIPDWYCPRCSPSSTRFDPSFYSHPEFKKLTRILRRLIQRLVKISKRKIIFEVSDSDSDGRMNELEHAVETLQKDVCELQGNYEDCHDTSLEVKDEKKSFEKQIQRIDEVETRVWKYKQRMNDEVASIRAEYDEQIKNLCEVIQDLKSQIRLQAEFITVLSKSK